MNALTLVGETLKEHSPAILVTVGVAGMVAATIFACKATTKMDDILKESEENVDKIENFNPEDAEYTEEDRAKDLKINAMKTRLKFVKLYLPAALIGLTSIAAILVGFKILNSRYLVATAAYATLEKVYDDYRSRIRKRFGEDADFYGKTGIERNKEFIVDQITTDEKGKEKIEHITEVKDVIAENVDCPFFHLIGPGDFLYDKFGGDMEHIHAQVNVIQNNCQRLYGLGNYVNLNKEVITPIYGSKSDKLTDIGQICGWCKDDKPSEEIGDGFVDLGWGTVWAPSMDGTESIMYGYICPNASQISFANINKVRHNITGRKSDEVKVVPKKSGKYIGM